MKTLIAHINSLTLINKLVYAKSDIHLIHMLREARFLTESEITQLSTEQRAQEKDKMYSLCAYVDTVCQDDLTRCHARAFTRSVREYASLF